MSGIQRQTVTAILIVTIGEELSTPKKKSPMENKGVRVMTDKERQEDEKLKKCLQTAYGATDEQLLKELEEAEASLDASEFPGAEERMFRRFMEMEREEREKENLSEDAVQDNTTVPGMDTAGGGMGADGTDKNKKKIRRLGKKKVFLVAALVTVFVGALGVTAVGEKNYFFRRWVVDEDKTIFNNDTNKTDISKLEEAYKKAEEELDITILKLGYVPSELQLVNLEISQDRVIFQFEYKNNKIYFVQSERADSTSAMARSDRSADIETIDNKWMDKDIELRGNKLKNQEMEYEVQFYFKGAHYLFGGKMEKDEFVEIVKNINSF